MTGAASANPPDRWAAPGFLRSDDRLARRATKGDRRAFEAIYERYHQDLYRFCLAILGNPQDAQDAMQNTMVKVLRALPGERRRIQLKPWLYRIARNEAIEMVRGRRESVEIDPEDIGSSAALEIAETAEARERLRGLLEDIRELPERQRSALVMRELAGLDFAQIGAAFVTSAAVARQTIYEARRSLRQMEAGREMSCEQVMRELSDADGRVTRRRELRAHVRSCRSCRLFQDEILQRRGDFAAIAPLPLAASAALLHGILGGQASGAISAGAGAGAGAGTGASAGAGTGSGLAGTLGAGAGKAVATSALVKSAATVAVVAAVGVSAADRSGLIDVPVPGVRHEEATQSASDHPHAAPALSRQAPAAAPQEGSSGGAGENGRAAEQASAGHRSSAHGEGRRGPAGSGHGNRASGRHNGSAHAQHRHHGHPASTPPSAAQHGQQTATAHRPPPRPHPTHPPAPEAPQQAPKAPPPPQESAPTPASPPVEPPGSGKANAPAQEHAEAQEIAP
jgi:RNA polymerase sigma factor (sigma-70 family)